MTENSLCKLETAAHLILEVVEGERIHEENAADKIAVFRLLKSVGLPPEEKEKPAEPSAGKNRKTVYRQAENLSKTSTLEEINFMLVQLNIKLKAKLRKDGLYEITPTFHGKRISIYGHSAEELADKFKKKVRQPLKKQRGVVSEPKQKKSSCSNLFAWLDEWLSVYKKPSVSKSTYDNLRRCIYKHVKPNIADKPLDEYSMTELTAGLNQIESTRMRQYARGTLKAAFSMAVSAEKVPSSPAQNLLPVKHIAVRGKAFALSELERLILAKNGLRREWQLYYIFCVFSGTRRDEALHITKSDLDFENMTIHIPGTKTEKSDRLIPMFPALVKIFRSLQVDKLRLSDRIFQISQHSADSNFKKFRGSKYPKAVLHWLRHTFGTIQICVNQIPANTVAKWMGHTDASTTTDIYTHPEDLAPDIYYSGRYSESEKVGILQDRYNTIISRLDEIL